MQKDIPKLITQSLRDDKIAGKDGSRLVYEITFNGTKQTTAVTVSSNGYIVGANPVSKFTKISTK